LNQFSSEFVFLRHFEILIKLVFAITLPIFLINTQTIAQKIRLDLKLI
jgi:hypothetical protein